MTLTPTEWKLLAVLADGRPHCPAELAAAIDEMATVANVQFHVCMLRRKFRGAPGGPALETVCHGSGLWSYRYVGPPLTVAGTSNA